MAFKIIPSYLAPGFFQLTEFALSTTIILWSEKLFSHRSNVSLLKFLSFIAGNTKLFHLTELRKRSPCKDEELLKQVHITYEDIISDIARVNNLDFIGNINTLRDKYFAHFDKLVINNFDELTASNVIRLSDIEDAIATSLQIIRRYSSAYNYHYPSMEPMDALDIDNILDYIHENYEDCK